MQTSQLTFTRFIAAMMIVYYHFEPTEFHTQNFFVNTLKVNLNQGVTYFYVLSGFVMMLAYGSKPSVKFWDYFKNRVARIFPLHIFALLLSLLVMVLSSINYLSYFKIDGVSLFFNAALLQAWIPEYSLSYNVPSWSVSVEMFFYVCFPFIFNHFVSKKKTNAVLIAVLLFWIAEQVFMNIFFHSPRYGGYNSTERHFLYFNPFFHLSSFLVGIGCGKYFLTNYNKIKGNHDFLIIAVVAFLLVLVYLLRTMFLHNGLLAIVFGVIILLISSNTGFITKIFRNRHLVYLGEISFAMYMLQNPVFIMTRKVFKTLHYENTLLIFFVGVSALLLASHLVFNFVEKPMRDKIRNLKFSK